MIASARSVPVRTTFNALRERYDALFLDAYGVLVNASGALPGAADAVTALVADQVPFLVVTNDASRSPERAARRFNELGIPVTPDHMMTSAMLLKPVISKLPLDERRTVVLGTGDSAQHVVKAGGRVTAPDLDNPANIVVIADEQGMDHLDMLDELLSMIVAAHNIGRVPLMLLANPDLVYPSGRGPNGWTFGFTAGSLAGMIERALEVIIGPDAPRFTILGKPSPTHFEAAIEKAGTRNAVMVGDTLHTDIAGAAGVGIDSALVLTGVTTEAQLHAEQRHIPTWVLDGLQGT